MPEDITLRTIQIDEKPLIYSLERKDVKNINLHVRKNGSVYVSANMAVPAEKIDAFLVSKAEFILNAQKKFALQEQYKPQPKQYVSGETFYLQGRALRLKVYEPARNSCILMGSIYSLRSKIHRIFQKKSEWL